MNTAEKIQPFVSSPSGFELQAVGDPGAIGADEAAKLLTLNTHPGQRPLRQSKIDRLVRKMKSGDWVGANLAIAIKPDGAWVLVDGQHTLTAIIESGIASIASLKTYRVADDDGLRRLFTQVDTNRTLGEHVRAFNDGQSDPLFNKFVSGLFALLDLQSPSSIKGVATEERVTRARGYPNELQFVRDVLAPISANRSAASWIGRAPVVAAMIATFRADPIAARQFWSNVRDGYTGISAKSGPALLRDALMRVKHKGGRTGRVQIYGICIAAWNAYRRNEEREFLKPCAPSTQPD